MFQVTANEITYDGRVVGYLLPDLQPTLHDEVVGELESHVLAAVSGEDHEAEIREIEDAHADELANVERERDELQAIVAAIDDGVELVAQLREAKTKTETLAQAYRDLCSANRELRDQLTKARKRK